SGVLSALGLAVSDLRRDYLRPAGASFDELEAEAARDLPGAGFERLVDARYRGQSYELTVPAEGYEQRFGDAHEQRYGFHMDDEVEVVSIRLVATVAAKPVKLSGGTGAAVVGPAVVDLGEATCLVREGWAGAPDAAGMLVLERR